MYHIKEDYEYEIQNRYDRQRCNQPFPTYGFDRLNTYYDDIQVEKSVICSPHITEEKAKDMGLNVNEKMMWASTKSSMTGKPLL